MSFRVCGFRCRDGKTSVRNRTTQAALLRLTCMFGSFSFLMPVPWIPALEIVQAPVWGVAYAPG